MDNYLQTALNISDEASKRIREGFSLDIHTDWKADGTPLTVVDTAVNTLVINRIKSEFPEHGVLGEEESFNLDAEYKWVCDPIDGTVSYAHGLNISTFSLALVKDGKPIVAVVSDPFQGLTYEAVKGEGSKLNGKSIQVDQTSEIPGKIISIEGKDYFGYLIKNLMMQSVFTAQYKSFIYGAKQVASGHAIASIFGWGKPWDCAALKLIVEEAGGMVTDLDGNQQRYDEDINGCLISNGKVHDKLLELIKKSKLEFEKYESKK